MNIGSRFLLIWIYYFCTITVHCNELASCYTEPPELCPITTAPCKCTQIEASSVFCCRVRSNDDLLQNLGCSSVKTGAIKALHIYNMTAERFDFGQFSFHLNNLISLSITSSYVNRLLGRLEHTHQIACLNFSNNAFGTEWQDPLALEQLKLLAMLDFSRTNISTLPVIKNEVTKFWIDISNNNNTNCDSLLELMGRSKNDESKQLLFKNSNDTFCMAPRSFHWFNSTEILAYDQIKIIDKINTQCPNNCKCKALGMDMVSNRNVLHTVEVDCSNNKLSNLPKSLPENTVKLDVTNNNITDIDELVLDAYKDLRFFYADHNKISNILPLEGSRFLSNFAILSLKHNQLKSIPMYVFDYSFDREFDGHILNLGGNQLQCDCSTAQTFKAWLIRYKHYMRDFDEVLCEKIGRVIDLDQKIVCVTQTEWTDYMYYIIAAEISALLLLIGKVSYDYWVFKTAGYLPWPASKMPKLPCDWVFE
ncbi:protein halfway isoform X2 [Adelges cooleyi]|nr:protein halfway isoform X2 [Adelges cooleyi]XP_050431509.1 protein halfway isoform X2 [Adelges cooleyi]